MILLEAKWISIVDDEVEDTKVVVYFQGIQLVHVYISILVTAIRCSNWTG